MAKQSSDLYELIQSLSAPEKAYVKRYGFADKKAMEGQHQLLKILEKQNQCDEDEVQKKMGGKSSAALSNFKGRLYKTILDKLLDYHKGKDAEDEVLQASREVWLLINRGLDNQALKRLRVAKKQIKKTDLAHFEPALNKAESMLIPYSLDRIQERFDALDGEKANLDLLQNWVSYKKLYTRMTEIVARRGVIVRDPEHIREVDEILSDPLLQDDALADHFVAKYMLHSVNKILNQCICRYDESLIQARKCLDLFDRFPDYRVLQERYYLLAVNNLLNDLVGLRQFDEFDQYVEKLKIDLKEIKRKDTLDEAQASLDGRVLYRLLIAREFDKAAEYGKQMQERLYDFNYQPHMLIQHHYMLACAYFYVEDYDACQERLGHLLNDQYLKWYPDYESFVLILNLIFHLEKDDREHLEYVRNRVKKHLERSQRLFKVEEVLLNFLRSLEKSPADSSLLKSMYKDLLAEMRPLMEDDFERNAFSYFDFEVWLEAKISGRSMREQVN
jgi:hypothetical protein